MDPKTFFYKVAEMREAQKDYFRTRSSIVLSKSKALEREIDAEITRVNAILAGKHTSVPTQQSLFPKEEVSQSNAPFCREDQYL